mmetsp:Transcript_42352/g.68688  ORF Transcript_42352/g.68688 Transcript_42352/m.68688 type:complete len:311 (-) Transcript_42352:779-1711(-)
MGLSAVQAAQTGTLIALLFGGILSSSVPFFLKRTRTVEKVLSLLNALASGVILGGAIAHLIPDAMDSFDLYFKLRNTTNSYPFVSVISTLVLLVLFAINRLLAHGHSHSHTQSSPLPFSSSLHETPRSAEPVPECSMVLDKPVAEHGDVIVKNQQSLTRRALIFLVAMSFHSIFEGLALGSSLDLSTLSSLIVAILAHKFLESFVIGLNVYNGKFSRQISIAFIVFYNSVAPAGIAVGIAVTLGIRSSSGAALTQGILISVAAGSMLYVSLIEILPEEFPPNEKFSRLMFFKYLALFFGWGFMSFITLYA